MTLTASKRFINNTAVGFTPTGGSLIPITGVTSTSIDPGVEELRGAGDGDFYDSFAGLVSANPKVRISTNEPYTLNSVAPGTYGVLTITRSDAVNKSAVGGGGIIYTVTNAYYMPMGDTAGHRQLATGEIEFHTLSVDGTTNPIAVAAL